MSRVRADQSRGVRINPLLAERSTLGDVIRKREQALCAHALSLLTDTMMEDGRKQIAPSWAIRFYDRSLGARTSPPPSGSLAESRPSCSKSYYSS